MAGSATTHLAVQILEVDRKNVHFAPGQLSQEVRSIEPSERSGALLRNPTLLVPVDRCGQAHFAQGIGALDHVEHFLRVHGE